MEASAPGGLPVMRSGEHPIPPEFLFDVYHDTNAPLFDTDVPGRDDEFWMDTADYLVDDVVVGRLDTGPHSMRRATRQLRQGSTDWIMLQIHHTGGVCGAAGRDTPLDLGPDQVGIVDLSQPIAAWNRGGVSTCVAVPRHRVAAVDRLPAVWALDRSSLRGRILDAAISDLWGRLAHARADEAGELAGGIAETVNSVLAVEDFMPTDRDLSLAMRDYLKVNLSDLDLDVDDLRATFHCSRATVYRLFKPQGGVAEYIREQRLLRCFEELTRPAKLPRLTSEVATRWGFENPSHFNRLFKAMFGLPPSGLKSLARDDRRPNALPSSLTSRVEQFHTWTLAGS